MLHSWIMFSQGQDLTLILKVLIRPLFQPIQVFLQYDSLEASTSPLSLISLSDFIRIHLITSSRSPLKILNTVGPYIHPWGASYVTGCQSENKLFPTPLCVQPIRRFPTHHRAHHRRQLWETELKTLEKSRWTMSTTRPISTEDVTWVTCKFSTTVMCADRLAH